MKLYKLIGGLPYRDILNEVDYMLLNKENKQDCYKEIEINPSKEELDLIDRVIENLDQQDCGCGGSIVKREVVLFNMFHIHEK